MEINLTELVELVVEKANSERLIPHLGEVTERQRAGLLIKPQDARYGTIRLGFEDNDLVPSAVVRQILLVPRPGVNLPLSFLADRFGSWVKMVPEPAGALHKVRFRYDMKRGENLVFVYVSLTGEPEEASSTVKEILIYRDLRL